MPIASDNSGYRMLFDVSSVQCCALLASFVVEREKTLNPTRIMVLKKRSIRPQETCVTWCNCCRALTAGVRASSVVK